MTLTTTARCIECDWTTTGPDADRAAEKHTKSAGHSTGVVSRPGNDHTEEGQQR